MPKCIVNREKLAGKSQNLNIPRLNVWKKIKGWDRRGIRRFNNIVTAVRKNRELSESKNMELELKSRYTEVSGKATENNEDEIDYDSELDELNGYDGFAGVTESNNNTVENMANGVDLNAVTNITEL